MTIVDSAGPSRERTETHIVSFREYSVAVSSAIYPHTSCGPRRSFRPKATRSAPPCPSNPPVRLPLGPIRAESGEREREREGEEEREEKRGKRGKREEGGEERRGERRGMPTVLYPTPPGGS